MTSDWPDPDQLADDTMVGYRLGFVNGFQRAKKFAANHGFPQADDDAVDSSEVPADHLATGTSVEAMSRQELVDLIAIKCQTINNRMGRARTLQIRIAEALGQPRPVNGVPLETTVDRLLERLSHSEGGEK